MRTFSDSALPLSFSYPSALTPLDAKAATDLGERILYGEDNSSDSDKVKSGAGCIRTLMAVGEDGRVMVRLALFEIDLSCIPPKAAKNRKLMDETLRGLASQGNEVLGMVPMDDPVGFLLAGNHAFFAAAQGTPVSATALQSSEGQVTATIAVEVEGHDGREKILAWHVDSSDTAMFNRLLACPVVLGTGQAVPLFPARAQ
jgi:hypothetical protein